MTSPADGMQLSSELVVKALTRTELGSALWREAQLIVVTEMQAERIRQLEEAQNAQASTPPEGRDVGWEIPPE